MFRNPRSAALMGYDGPEPGRAKVTTTGGERMAGAGSKNFLEEISQRLGGGNNARKAGGPGIRRALSTAGRIGVPLVGLQVLGSAVGAGKEFDGEGAGIDTAQAAGRFVGDLGSNLALAALGAPLGPVGAIGLPVLASLLGVQEGVGKAGAGLFGAAYDTVTGNSADRRYRKQTELEAERLMHMAQVNDVIAKMGDARALNMARQNAEILTDYNFANNLNTSSLMLQQNEANALNIALNNLL